MEIFRHKLRNKLENNLIDLANMPNHIYDKQQKKRKRTNEQTKESQNLIFVDVMQNETKRLCWPQSSATFVEDFH